MNQPSIYNRQGNIPRIGHQARGGLGVQSHPRISIRGNNFLLINAEGDEWAAPTFTHPQKRVPMLLAVIVGANPHKSKVYYPDVWSGPGEGVPPICFSDNGYGPSAHSQEAQSDSCATCKWSKWGSATSKLTGKGIPACSDKKKIALMVIGDEEGLTYELQIPPASIGAFGAYVDKILGMQLPGGARETDVFDVVTSINFGVGQTGILEFSNLCWTECVQIGQNGELALAFNSNGLTTSPDGGWGLVQRIEEVWNAGSIDQLVGLKDQVWQPGQGINVNALPGRQGMPATLAAPQPPAQSQFQRTQEATPPHPQGPYAPPPGVPPSQPVPAFVPAQQAPQPAEQQAQAPAAQPAHGGARRGAGRKPRAAAPQQQQLPAPSNVVQHPAAAAAPQQEGIPPFLQRTQAGPSAPGPSEPAPGHVGMVGPGNGAANFGMTNAPPPPPGIESALDRAFQLKTE